MNRRIPELDGLRALAAGVVLLFHLNPPKFAWGWTGVDLFFVLSGYLITGIILANLDRRRFLLTFYVRRGLRIWPIYYLTLAVLVATTPWVPPDRRPALDGIGYYLLYLQNIWLYWLGPGPKFHIAFDHTWTLALEEQFYCVWPALVVVAAWSGWDTLVLAADRLGRRAGLRRPLDRLARELAWTRVLSPRGWRVLALCLAAIALAWMAREGGYIRLGRLSERLLVARCDGLALGGLMAVLLAEGRGGLLTRRWLGPLFTIVGLLGFGWLAWSAIETGGLGFLGLPTPADPATTLLAVNLAYCGLVGLVVCAAGRSWLAPLRWRPLCANGVISYGIYLYHYPIYWAFDRCRFQYEESPGRAALKIGTTLAVAIASWFLIERPFLRLKDRFDYGARPAPTAAGLAAIRPVDEVEEVIG